jgi:predicted nucleic acid-binding protein
VPEVDLVVDTDVLIDALRGDNRAGAWLATIEPQVLGIPVLVWMEILLGVRDKQEQQAVSQELARYVIVQLESGDSQNAQQWFEQFHLSHGIGIMDCLIAAIAVRVGKPFYTFNLKHFQVIPGLDARAPYERPAVPTA